MQNKLDRFHLVIDAVKLIPSLGNRGASLVQKKKDKLVAHKMYIREYGMDLPEVETWVWEQV